VAITITAGRGQVQLNEGERGRAVLAIDEVGEGDIGLVGPKAANLADILGAGFPVPWALLVPSTEYDDFLRSNGLYEKIEQILTGTDFENARVVQESSRSIKALITGPPLREGLQRAILEGLDVGRGRLWAVRSSAIAEDLGDASFAGQQDTYLSVPRESVPEHVKRCWASYWNERAMSYRNDNEVSQLRTGMAVIVQVMVDSKSSGIMFTKDPVSGDDKVIIEASFGLGEAIASGLVSPDRFVCDGRSCRLEHRQINRKERALFLTGPAEAEDLPEETQGRPALETEQAEELARIGLRLEGRFGSPQDIEWAMDDRSLYVLQSRPITTLVKDRTLWTRAYGDEYWADVTSPLFFSLLGEYLTKYVNHEGSAIMGYKDLTDKELLRVHKGHIYFNTEVLEEVFTYNPKFSRTKELLNYFPIKDQDRIANARTRVTRRLWAEVRIAVLDPDGTIFRTNKAYDRWAAGYIKAMEPFDALDLTKVEDERLLQEFRSMENAYLKHFRLIRYGMVTHSIGTNLMVKRWLSDWLDDRSGVLYSKVISGLKGNKTIETNMALARLADQARSQPPVAKRLRELPSRRFLEELWTEDLYADFRIGFSEFLDQYGHRSHTREIYFPRWTDDPALVVDVLKALVQSPQLDLEEMESRKVKERKEAEREILARVRKMRFGLLRRKLFKVVLGYAQTYLMFRENQRFYLDHILQRWRRLFMEYGRRFRERGVLDKVDDIFFLSKEEIFSMSTDAMGDARRAVETRRKEFDRYKDRLPPKFLRGNAEFDDTVIWQGNVLRISGTSVSPGTCTGPVRVVDTIEQLSEVKDHEILVTTNTDPGWTAVFSKIGGLITETGGILSHGAVVSREYGIPAVTAVKGATKIFKTGQRITLDGNEGTIYVLEG
jgi:phosphohistidine swiveling domain-containing protein